MNHSTSILIGSNGSGGPATMFEDESSNNNQKANSNNASSFPSKLLSMLNESYDRGFSHIVSWQMNDAAFKVHSPSEFVKRVMPLYFNQTKYKSFQRQLNLYGFARITRGPNKGCYVHEMFQRCDECKCLSITRKRVTDPDEEYGDDYDLGLCLGAPTWLNHSSMLADVEPDPIADGAAGAAASNNKPSSSNSSNNKSNMLNAFENFFQSNVVGSSTSQGDDDLKKFKKSSSSSPTTESSAAGGESCTTGNKQQPPQENALQRMLEGYLGPKPKEGEDRCNGENQNQKNQEDHESTSNATGRKKYQRAAVFPDKLHDMLDYASQHNLEDVASWQMDGRAFKVHNIQKFMTDIMPLFFKQSKYESLQRQLNLYGFTRVPKGPMKGCYHHPLFIKGGRELSSGMARRKQDDYDCSTNTCYPTDVVSSSSLNNSSNKSSAAIKKHQKQKASSNKQEMTLKNLVRPDMIPSQQQREEGRGSCLSMTTIGGDDSCLGNGWDPSMMSMAALPTPIASGNGSALPATIMDTSSGTNQNSGCGGNMLFSSNSNMTSVGAAVPSFSSSSVSPSINNIMMSSSSSATRQPASGSSLFEQDYFMSTMGSSSMNNSSGNNNIAGNTNNGDNCGFAAQPWATQNNGLPPLPFDSMMNNSGNNNNVGSRNRNSIINNNDNGGGFAAQPWGHLARPMFPSNNNNNNGNRRGGNLTRGVSNGSQQDMGSSAGNGNNGNGGNNMFAAMPWMQPQQQRRQQQQQLSTMHNNNTNNNVVEGMFGFVPTVMTDFQNSM